MKNQFLRAFVFAFVSACIAYGIERYSFAFAHSPAALLVIAFFPPVLLVVFGPVDGGLLLWVVAVAINCIYFEMLWRVLQRRSTPT